MSTANQDSIVIDGHMQVTAVFQDPQYYTLAFWIKGKGRVDLTPSGCTYPEQTQVTLTTVPDPGRMFDSWGINLNGSNNPEMLIMDSNKSVNVTFVESTGIASSQQVDRYTLYQNYPNPFNTQKTIIFSLTQPGWTTMTIYDAIGEGIDVLVDGKLPVGDHRVVFNASKIASGV